MDKKEILKMQGPILIASNHPNSFLDAVIIDILFDMPVTSLARGDAFKNKKVYKILSALNMLPIYRMREGAENLNNNYDTFDECIKVFRKKQAVLIFSEGICVNEWHLRPLMKGTARLALKAWKEDVPLMVLPTGMNYSSYGKYGKKVKINFGDFFVKDDFDMTLSDGNNYTIFNEKLKSQLEKLVYEIQPEDHRLLTDKFGKTSTFHKIILAPFALLGWLFHTPLYGLTNFVRRKYLNRKNDYDSVSFGFPMLIYPIYLLLVTIILFIIFNKIWVLFAFLFLPFTAYCFARYEIRKGKTIT